MPRSSQYLNGSDLVVNQLENAGMWQNFPVAGHPPYLVSGYFSDFFQYVDAEWTSTEVNASTETIQDKENGWLSLTSAGAENDGAQIQLGTSSTGEAFLPKTGRTIWFESRFEMNDVTQADAFLGLSINSTAILASNPANMIGFITHDGDALLDFYHNGSVIEGVATLVDGAEVVVGFKMIGTNYCEAWVDGVKVATVTTDLPATEMKLSLAHLTGEAAANTLEVDYVACYQTRA